jgi:hypothetical protein
VPPAQVLFRPERRSCHPEILCSVRKSGHGSAPGRSFGRKRGSSAGRMRFSAGLSDCSEGDRLFRAKTRSGGRHKWRSIRNRGAATRASAERDRSEVVPVAAPVFQAEFRSCCRRVPIIGRKRGRALPRPPIWPEWSSSRRIDRSSRQSSGLAAGEARCFAERRVVPAAGAGFWTEQGLWGWQDRLSRPNPGGAARDKGSRGKGEAER